MEELLKDKTSSVDGLRLVATGKLEQQLLRAPRGNSDSFRLCSEIVVRHLYLIANATV